MRRSQLWSLLPALSLVALFVNAQDGSLSGPGTTRQAANYNCDPTKCKLPDCACASTNIPGGISKDQTPMFLVLSADDAVQSYTINAMKSIMQNRTNPNGCPISMTYFTQVNWTDFSLVTDWYVAGHEIADHTMTHPELGGPDEILGNLKALNALAGIPLGELIGFRAPFLNYSSGLLTTLQQSGFLYDSSATAASPVEPDNETDAYWPYTLDNGLANDCLTFDGICAGKPALPGIWEIPMYAIFDEKGAAGIHLMDPWLDSTNPADSVPWMKNTFTAHMNANKQPFGVYSHPIHFSSGYPGLPDPTPIVDAINEFLDWAQQQPNVWIVNNKQLLDWVRAPVPYTQLNNIPSFKCQTPVVNAKICNGVPANENGLESYCAFDAFPFSTCYGCPVAPPMPSDPNPAQVAVNGQMRTRLPNDCQTAFWDPVGAKCLCQSQSCEYTDQTRPIGNLTSNSTTPLSASPSGSSGPGSPSGSPSAGGDPAKGKTTGGAGFRAARIDVGVIVSVVLGAVGIMIGAGTTLFL